MPNNHCCTFSSTYDTFIGWAFGALLLCSGDCLATITEACPPFIYNNIQPRMPNNVECGSVKYSTRPTAYRVSVCAKTPTESVRFRYSALASSSTVAMAMP